MSQNYVMFSVGQGEQDVESGIIVFKLLLQETNGPNIDRTVHQARAQLK
jgi:hypothetical protein